MRLDDWLKKENLTKAWFASRIEVPPSTIARIIGEDRAPTHQIMERIILGSDGKVLPNDFFDLSKLLKRGKP